MSEPVSKLQEALLAGKFVVTGEIGPPKGTNVGACLHEASQYLKNTVVAVNVTDIQTAVMRAGSMAISHMLLDDGIDGELALVQGGRDPVVAVDHPVAAVELLQVDGRQRLLRPQWLLRQWCFFRS